MQRYMMEAQNTNGLPKMSRLWGDKHVYLLKVMII